MRWVDLPAGRVRVFDSGGTLPCIVFTPDGPNVIEHHLPVLALLRQDFRVICFDMPGFGLSWPSAAYSHSLDQGAATVLQLMDRLAIDRATLAFSCANGLYALRVALRAPQRVHSLFLAQTPSLAAMQAWAHKTVPGVLRVPVAGQLVGWAARERAARSWYRQALPRGTDPEPFRGIARHAMRCGACFSLAGVVQGLLRESEASLRDVAAPCTVLWGNADRSHRATAPDALRALVPHAQVIESVDCGHFPDLEQPERYVALLRAHLSRC